ncbi:MAG TPA: divergent polysaccharide deacetylase family protein, partial [Azospirillaceae bacterium]|nr:divergent polysaccharide deacetylase family protein [Azospirillaceae bacterium]
MTKPRRPAPRKPAPRRPANTTRRAKPRRPLPPWLRLAGLGALVLLVAAGLLVVLTRAPEPRRAAEVSEAAPPPLPRPERPSLPPPAPTVPAPPAAEAPPEALPAPDPVPAPAAPEPPRRPEPVREAAPLPPVPPPPEGEPAWRRFAVPAPPADGRPRIVLVIDDMGPDRRRSDRVVALPGPVTTAWLPYARDLAAQTRAARAAGHELIVHMPMEPGGGDDPGPDALRT